MKKDIFKKLVEFLNSSVYLTYVSTVWEDNKEVYTYQVDNQHASKGFDTIKDMVKTKGYKDADAIMFVKCNRTEKYYYSVCYNHDTDKISGNTFKAEYRWSYKTNSIYYKSSKRPEFCYSKQFYVFNTAKQVRVLTQFQFWGMPMIIKESIMLLLNSKTNMTFDIPYKYYINTNNNAEVIEKYLGIKLPKVLVNKASDSALFLVLNALKDMNQINTICQRVNKFANTQDPIMYTVSEIMGYDDVFTLRDYISDMNKLGLKELNLRVTSAKRINEDHRRLWKLRMMENVKKITVNEKFNSIMDGLANDDLTIELIKTGKRLRQESMDMDHCVATYANLINHGETAIYSLVYKGIRYTLQVSMVNGKFMNSQMRGRFNCSAPVELHELINNHLHNIPVVEGTFAPVEELELF